jgi:hypothetical protein
MVFTFSVIGPILQWTFFLKRLGLHLNYPISLVLVDHALTLHRTVGRCFRTTKSIWHQGNGQDIS